MALRRGHGFARRGCVALLPTCPRTESCHPSAVDASEVQLESIREHGARLQAEYKQWFDDSANAWEHTAFLGKKEACLVGSTALCGLFCLLWLDS